MSIIAKCPECNNEFLYKGHAKRPRPTCSKCKTKFYLSTRNTQNNHIKQGEDIKINLSLKGGQDDSQSSISIPPQDTTQALQFIDDPDELLLSVSMRELNKPNPDPRWANVLITTRRENIGISKKEGIIQSKFKSMSIKEVSKILARKQESILLKPDLKESS